MSEEGSEKLLRREVIIRYTGVLLAFSPIGNFLSSAGFSHIPHWWYPRILLTILKSVNGGFWFLSGLTILAGLLMLKGRRSSWIFTLTIIGLIILSDLNSFLRDIQDGWLLPSLSLAFNCAFFGLIYAQEFHQRLEKKIRDAQLNRPFALEFRRGIRIDFDGHGSWAEITGVTNRGLLVRPLAGLAPSQIETRTVEISFARDLILQARCMEKTGNGYFFRFTNLSPSTLGRLQRWAQKKLTGGSRSGGQAPARERVS
jgi:hypothetical protein